MCTLSGCEYRNSYASVYCNYSTNSNPFASKAKKRVLRIAHMTDFHVQPEGIAPAGMARACIMPSLRQTLPIDPRSTGGFDHGCA